MALKENGVYGVDILDYTYHGKTYPLIKDWIRIAEEEGFYFKDKIAIASRFRKREGEGEYAYLFMKTSEAVLPDYTPGKIQLDAIEARKRLERAKYRKEHRVIGEYDIFGNLIELYSEENSPVDKKIYKSKNNFYNNKYYKIYYGEDVVQQALKVKQPVCYLDNQYFFTYSEVGRYCNISRQAVQQSKGRNSKLLVNKPVIWF